MKRRWLFVAPLCAAALAVSVSLWNDHSDPQSEIPESLSASEIQLLLTQSPTQVPLTEPPNLTVTFGGDTQTLWRSSYSWTLFDQGDEGEAVVACGPAPWDAQEALPTVTAQPGDILTFSAVVPPDQLTVRTYSLEGEEGTEVPLTDGNTLVVPEGETGLIYEVIGTWDSAQRYGGCARYALYIP